MAKRQNVTGSQAHSITRDKLKEIQAPWEQRWKTGKALRERVPREKHAGWAAPRNRPDPVELLSQNESSRLQQLVPIRHARMLTSPFAFFRGAAAIMASDLSRTSVSGIRVEACGDCHLLNFGAFATPEREVIFDINDFDETLPAPWEWDVKRLAASVAVAARHIGRNRRDASRAAESGVRSYRKWMTKYSQMHVIDIWYDHLELETVIKAIPDPISQKRWQARVAKEGARYVAEHDFPKLTTQRGHRPTIKDNPPLIFHPRGGSKSDFHQNVTNAHSEYLESLPPHIRVIIERYSLLDVAVKVVGVGSVGTQCGIALLMASDSDPLFLQVKEADASVLEPYAGASGYPNHGQRVVIGQRFMQAASDILLGWTSLRLADSGGARDFYIRQLRDMKMSMTVEAMNQVTLEFYANVCGRVLARAHSRSSDPTVIAGYMGNSRVFDEAIADFAMAYSAQTDRDHESLAVAVRDGRIKAASE